MNLFDQCKLQSNSGRITVVLAPSLVVMDAPG